MNRKLISWVAFAALMFGFFTVSGQVAAQKADATIEFEIVRAGLIVGFSGGSGTLHYKGKDYPLTIGGVSLGATIGASKAELVGEVFNLKKVEDIEGIYAAGKAGIAVAAGEKHAHLKNSKDVEINVKGKQVGLEFSLDLNGLEIKLK